MDKCRLTRDTIRIIVGLAHGRSVCNWRLVCKFTRDCISPENLLCAQKMIIISRLKKKHDAYIKNVIKNRLETRRPLFEVDKKEHKAYLNKWLAEPTVICKRCENPMFKHDLETHKCDPPKVSSFCEHCNLFFRTQIHGSGYMYNYRCPLQEITCADLFKERWSTKQIGTDMNKCNVTGPYAKISNEHWKTCEHECRVCEGKFLATEITKHFKTTANGSVYVCRKIK